MALAECSSSLISTTTSEISDQQEQHISCPISNADTILHDTGKPVSDTNVGVLPKFEPGGNEVNMDNGSYCGSSCTGENSVTGNVSSSSNGHIKIETPDADATPILTNQTQLPDFSAVANGSNIAGVKRKFHTIQDRCLPNGKKTKGRVKIKIAYIENKLRRYTTFSKRKTGILKKAQELAKLTGTQVLLVVASETGHVYQWATDRLKPVIVGNTGKQLINVCLSGLAHTEPEIEPNMDFGPTNDIIARNHDFMVRKAGHSNEIQSAFFQHRNECKNVLPTSRNPNSSFENNADVLSSSSSTCQTEPIALLAKNANKSRQDWHPQQQNTSNELATGQQMSRNPSELMHLASENTGADNNNTTNSSLSTLLAIAANRAKSHQQQAQTQNNFLLNLMLLASQINNGNSQLSGTAVANQYMNNNSANNSVSVPGASNLTPNQILALVQHLQQNGSGGNSDFKGSSSDGEQNGGAIFPALFMNGLNG